jgi:hypothetical protein
MGAYEFHGASPLTFQAWLAYYGLPTDGSADFIDSDGDGMNNWQEWVCGTNPTNALSALQILSVGPFGTNMLVSWVSVTGVNYFLERAEDPSSPFTLVATNIIGQTNTAYFVDTNAFGANSFFYRVGVRSP